MADIVVRPGQFMVAANGAFLGAFDSLERALDFIEGMRLVNPGLPVYVDILVAGMHPTPAGALVVDEQ